MGRGDEPTGDALDRSPERNLSRRFALIVGNIIALDRPMNKAVPVLLSLIPLAAVIGACVACP